MSVSAVSVSREEGGMDSDKAVRYYCHCGNVEIRDIDGIGSTSLGSEVLRVVLVCVPRLWDGARTDV